VALVRSLFLGGDAQPGGGSADGGFGPAAAAALLEAGGPSLLAEVEAFCVEHARVGEAAALFSELKGMRP
jgi:hypothetical protein